MNELKCRRRGWEIWWKGLAATDLNTFFLRLFLIDFFFLGQHNAQQKQLQTTATKERSNIKNDIYDKITFPAVKTWRKGGGVYSFGRKFWVLGEENTSKPLTPLGRRTSSQNNKTMRKNRGENEETFALSDFVRRGKKT